MRRVRYTVSAWQDIGYSVSVSVSVRRDRHKVSAPNLAEAVIAVEAAKVALSRLWPHLRIHVERQ